MATLYIRLIHPDSFDATQEVGMRIKDSAIPSSEMKRGVGPSIFLETKLPHGLSDLKVVGTKRENFGAARISTEELAGLTLEAIHTPEECEDEALKPAHYSIKGMTRAIRASLVELLDKNLIEPPTSRAA